MPTQLCVNECGRVVGEQLNVCCQPCQFGKPHTPECDAREALNDAIDKWWFADHFGDDCSISPANHSAECVDEAFKGGWNARGKQADTRKAAAYDRLREIANQHICHMRACAFWEKPSYRCDCGRDEALGQIAALDAEVRG